MKETIVVRSVVIFEDHTLENFRPLALSVPTYEIRVGIFNLRERVELVLEELGADPSRGTLLSRTVFNDLHGCGQWLINPASFSLPDTESERVLWLSGRCLPDFGEIASLLNGDSGEAGFIYFDEQGLVAADISQDESYELWQSWVDWNRQFDTDVQDVKNWEWPGKPAEKSETTLEIRALGHIWDIVPATSDILAQDLAFLADGKLYSRQPFGIFPAENNTEAFWLKPSSLIKAASSAEFKKLFPGGGEDIWLGEGVQISPSVAFDTSNGPIILDNQVTVMPHCFLEGPLYVGPGSRIKAGATIYGESSFGIGNRISGEIAESTFADFANKQHDGFIGHAVIGSWTNLGAMTTCSDLKNNYGNVRVDLGSGTVDTGLRFVGLLMGDHVKTAIGTLFNTGTSVGFASNIFGGTMPPKFVSNFSWGGLPENPSFNVDKAIETAAIVMSRRGCHLGEAGKKLIRYLS